MSQSNHCPVCRKYDPVWADVPTKVCTNCQGAYMAGINAGLRQSAAKGLRDADESVLEWLLDTASQAAKAARRELRRRKAKPTADLLDQILQAGYRAMAKQSHPDLGGSADKFMKLKSSLEQLKVAVGVIREMEQPGGEQVKTKRAKP